MICVDQKRLAVKHSEANPTLWLPHTGSGNHVWIWQPRMDLATAVAGDVALSLVNKWIHFKIHTLSFLIKQIVKQLIFNMLIS